MTSLLFPLLLAALTTGYCVRYGQERVQTWCGQRRRMRLLMEKTPFIEPRTAGRCLQWEQDANG